MRLDLFSIRSKKGLEILIRQFYSNEWDSSFDGNTVCEDLSRFIEDVIPNLSCTFDTTESSFYFDVNLFVNLQCPINDNILYCLHTNVGQWESETINCSDAIDFLWNCIETARTKAKRIIITNKSARLTI